jgi:hypothetical protein
MDEFYWHGRRISRETPMMPVYRTMQDGRPPFPAIRVQR